MGKKTSYLLHQPQASMIIERLVAKAPVTITMILRCYELTSFIQHVSLKVTPVWRADLIASGFSPSTLVSSTLCVHVYMFVSMLFVKMHFMPTLKGCIFVCLCECIQSAGAEERWYKCTMLLLLPSLLLFTKKV